MNCLLSIVAENPKSVTIVSYENVQKFRTGSINFTLLMNTVSAPFKLWI